MFDELVESTAKKATHKRWTVILSAIIQVVIVSVFILIPLIYTEALPKQFLTTFLVAPAPPPPPPPPAAAVQRIVKPVVRLMHNGKLQAPTVIPKKVQMIKEEELPPDVGGGRGWRRAGRRAGWVCGRSSRRYYLRRWGSAASAAEGQRLREFAWVETCRRRSMAHQVLPVYPEIAKSAHIQGTVMLHAIIDKDGSSAGVAIYLRAAAVDESGDGCRSAMAVSADAAQWRAGGSGYHDFCGL